VYQVIIFNANVETIINYPSADETVPHLLALSLQEKLSLVNNLTFTIPFMNIGYNLIKSLSTKIKVTDINGNDIFIGRVLNVGDEMNNSGIFSKTVICEDALAYLIDSSTDQFTYQDQTPTQILTSLLTSHNAQVNDVSKTILLGTIELINLITVSVNYESTLNAIIKNLINILGGDIRVRETAGLLYLDYLIDQGANNNVKIELGRNQQSLLVNYDPTTILTRIIPLGYGEGINQLNIKSANSGLNYINDLTSQAEYGIITTAITNKDIQNASTLKIWGQTYLTQNSKPVMTVEAEMTDLSLINLDLPVSLGDTIEVDNSVMQFDIFARIIEKETDLLAAYNPKLVIDTKPIRLSTQQISLVSRISSLENAPQGNTFITTLNACDNLDEVHSIIIPLWLSPDIIYVNRVMLHVESQKFRAYEKGMAAAAQQVVTSSSGGGSTQTSSSGGASTPTSSSGGASTPTSSSGGSSTPTSSAGGDHSHIFASYAGGNTAYTVNDYLVKSSSDFGGDDRKVAIQADSTGDLYTENVTTQHTHTVSIPDHTHTVSIPDHTHTVSVPAHTHDVVIPDHTHTITIPEHTHAIQYGIFEDTYTAGCKILVDGVIVADGPNEGSSIDIDISQWVGTPGQTYSLEVSSTQRGRVSVQVNIQAFIQSK